MERLLSIGLAAVSAGMLVFVLVRSLFAVRGEMDDRESGIRMLLALPAAYFIRRRELDRELARKLEQLEVLRIQAGCRFLDGATAPEIFAARLVLPALAVLFILMVGALLRLPAALVLPGLLLFAGLLYVWPETALKEMARTRTSRFIHDLPMALDVMRLVCQSGGDLYAAVRSVVEVIGDSPVREELVRAVNEVAIGTSLAAALAHVGERIALAEANAVFSTLSQALEMGTSVSENLQSASGLIRHSQRVKAQAKAQKAVVTMTFPLLLLILPGVFIVLFAPLIIQYVNR